MGAELSHPAPGRTLNYTIETFWHAPTDVDKTGSRQVSNPFIRRDWTTSYWINGLRLISSWRVIKPNGETYRKEEAWGAGKYRLDFYVRGQLITSGSFEMVETQSR
ncbi:MAG TPA: hypothetical protein VGL11_08880 [Candidatus Binatia bacterium]